MLTLALIALSLGCLSEQNPISSIFSPQDLECMSNGTAFYPRDNKCYDILQQGPCARNQWLVLDTDLGQVRAKCEDCRCCRESSKKIFWVADGQCHRSSDKLCASGNKVSNDLDGTGICVCKDGYVRVSESQVECHPLYQRSTVCPQGQYLRMTPEGRGQCQVNPCRQDGLAPWTDGDRYSQDRSHCYTLNTQGPCPEVDQIFRVLSSETDLVGCFSPAFSITKVPTLCSTGPGSQCKPPITFGQSGGGRPNLSNKLQSFLKRKRISVDSEDASDSVPTGPNIRPSITPTSINPGIRPTSSIRPTGSIRPTNSIQTSPPNNYGPSSNTWAWD